MVGVDEAIRLAMALPDVTTGTSYGNRTWLVGRTSFAWLRPFSKADVKRFGDAPVPGGPIFAVRVADLRAKEAVLAEGARGVFTIPHFDGYPAVLIRLEAVAKSVLKRLLTDAWLACSAPAPPARRRARARKRQ